MSNIALANLTPVASTRQPDAVAGKTAVDKKDSTSAKSQQVDVQKQVTSTKDGLQTEVSSSKTLPKFSFKELLQKRLTKDSANDKSDTPSKKQVIVNNGVTTENKKTKTTDKETQETTNPLLSAVMFTQQPLEMTKKQAITAVTTSKPLPNQPLKAIQSTKSAATETQKEVLSAGEENTKAVIGKEVTADKVKAKEARPFTAVEQKEVKHSAEIKDASTPTKGENSPINAVSAQISNIPQTRQGVSQDTINLPADPKAAVKMSDSKTQVNTNTEDTNIEKDAIPAPKTQAKAKVAATSETSNVTQTVTSSSHTEVATSIESSNIRTEVISPKQVTTVTPEKTFIQSTTLPATEQIIDKVQNTITGSTQQIQITLTPAELGTVRITLRQQEGQIEGLLEVQNPEVRKEVEKALPQIAAALAQNGIQVRRMDIAPMTHQQSSPDSNQAPEHEFSPSDQRSLGDNGHSGGSGSSGERFFDRDVQLLDGMQDPSRPTYDLSGLNMFA